MTVDYIGFAYAATVAAGGIIGYVKAGMIFIVYIIQKNTKCTIELQNKAPKTKIKFSDSYKDI